jgi:MFS family permease
VACGLSQTVWQFVLARVVQGVAGALMVPVGRLIVLRVTEKKDLIRAISTLTWPALLAPVLGPPVGGFVTTYASWRLIFFFNLPIGLVGLLVTLWLVPNARGTTRPFDVTGFLLSAAGLAGLLYGLDAVARPDVDAAAWTILLAGLVLCAVAIRHALGHHAPMLDLAARHVRSFAHTTLYSGNAFRVSTNSLLFLAPLLLQVGFGMTAFDAGSLILFGAAANLAMKTVTTPVLRRFGFRSVLIVNGTLTAASIAACVLLSPTSPAWWIVTVLVAQGMTRSMQYTTLNTLGFADIPPALTSGASTLASMIQQMSTGMGVAFGALMLHVALLLGYGGVAGFRFTFIVAALLCLASVPGAWRLPRAVGAALRPA